MMVKVIISKEIQQQSVEQFHMNHMGTEKTRILARESVHGFNMNDDIEAIKAVLYNLDVSTCSLWIR